ncbi:MAG: hypothetical protein H5U20_03140 [Rhodobacteraceae bacterium]|nr:hypothetical protein [Paracoccaceae bacterium]
MSLYSQTILDFLASGAPKRVDTLVWLSGRDFSTGTIEQSGLWTGDDSRLFTVDGVVREYFGHQSAIKVEPIQYGIGDDVRQLQVTLAGASPEVRQALLTYDPKFQPAEVHLAFFDLETMVLIDTPQRVWAGTINAVSIPRPSKGGRADVRVGIVSNARNGTIPLELMASHAALRARAPTDDFRKFAMAADAVHLWGKGT